MNSYATPAQFSDAFGLTELAQLLCDEQGLVTRSEVALAIAGETSEASADIQSAVQSALRRCQNILDRQTAFMDSFLAKRYTLPLVFSSEKHGQQLVECCLALSRAALADDGDNLAKNVIDERDFWRAWLKQVARGEVHIGATVAADQNSNGDTPRGYKTAQAVSGIDWRKY